MSGSNCCFLTCIQVSQETSNIEMLISFFILLLTQEGNNTEWFVFSVSPFTPPLPSKKMAWASSLPCHREGCKAKPEVARREPLFLARVSQKPYAPWGKHRRRREVRCEMRMKVQTGVQSRQRKEKTALSLGSTEVCGTSRNGTRSFPLADFRRFCLHRKQQPNGLTSKALFKAPEPT